jgi:hypothetical protein
MLSVCKENPDDQDFGDRAELAAATFHWSSSHEKTIRRSNDGKMGNPAKSRRIPACNQIVA